MQYCNCFSEPAIDECYLLANENTSVYNLYRLKAVFVVSANLYILQRVSDYVAIPCLLLSSRCWLFRYVYSPNLFFSLFFNA